MLVNPFPSAQSHWSQEGPCLDVFALWQKLLQDWERALNLTLLHLYLLFRLQTPMYLGSTEHGRQPDSVS